MTEIETIVLKNKDAFNTYNELRKKIALEIIPAKLKHIFQIIPFLLHINYPDIPGFVKGEDVPGGIYSFEVENEYVFGLNELFPSSKIWKDNTGSKKSSCSEFYPRNRDIESFLLMGSIGTVAQTKHSDYDYWVCIDKKFFSTKKYELLQLKLNRISEWCLKEYHMHTHFFIVDKSNACCDNFGSVDQESAGSSQGKILKEEFYRTLILQAGKIPLWWIMPVGISDVEYRVFKKEIDSLSNIDCSDFIDLGNVVTIKKEEFFGAALWQINKAMDYPFKSVLKMALLEIFLDELKKYDLLSNLIKQRVFKSSSNVRALDPYVVMFDSIIDYNLKEGRNDEATLIKKCFYIKTEVNLKNGKRTVDSMNYKEKIMIEYINEWGWDDKIIEDLNNFKNWKFNAVAGIGKEVHSFLRGTYVRLSDRLRKGKDIDRKISDTDMTVLARKLFTIYEKGPQKIEFLERAFDKGLLQKSVTLCALYTKKRKVVWTIFSGLIAQSNLSSSKYKMFCMKMSSNVLDLISWVVYNRICDKRTSFYLFPGPTQLELTNIYDVFFALYDFFPPIDMSALNNNDLLELPKKQKFFIAANFSCLPDIKEIEEISVFYTNSYGEFCFEHLYFKNALDKVIKYMIENSPKGVSDFSDYYRIFIPKGNYQRKIFSQIDNKIKELLKRESYRY